MRSLLTLLCYLAVCQPCLHASLAYESVYAFSELKSVSFEKLVRGEIIGTRTSLEGSELSLGAEFFYVVRLPPDLVLQKMKALNSPDGEESKTASASTCHPIRIPAELQDFAGLTLDPGSKGTERFLRQLYKNVSGGTGLNLSNPEKEKLASVLNQNPASDAGRTQAGRAAEALRELLNQRAKNFQTSGLMGCAPYENSGQRFEHGQETLRALRCRPRVLQAFSEILDPVMAGRQPADAPAPHFYWEMSDVQKEQTIGLGAFFSQPFDTGQRAAEVTYYVSSQYYLSLTLYQLIPVEIEGKPGTYVYRADFVLTPSVTRIKGIERIAAENILLVEIRKSVQSFVDRCNGM